MSRAAVMAFTVFTIFGSATTTNADWHSFWNRVHLDWNRNNCWPEPFVQQDANRICEHFSIQIANGWQRQNTLSEVYFDPDTQMLNEAGRRKVWTIMNTTPEPYRTIYVVQAMAPDIHERRVDSVQKVASGWSDESVMPQVIPVKITPRAWSAEYIDAIDRKVQTAMPDPVLPEFTDTTGGS